MFKIISDNNQIQIEYAIFTLKPLNPKGDAKIYPENKIENKKIKDEIIDNKIDHKLLFKNADGEDGEDNHTLIYPENPTIQIPLQTFKKEIQAYKKKHKLSKEEVAKIINNIDCRILVINNSAELGDSVFQNTRRQIATKIMDDNNIHIKDNVSIDQHSEIRDIIAAIHNTNTAAIHNTNPEKGLYPKGDNCYFSIIETSCCEHPTLKVAKDKEPSGIVITLNKKYWGYQTLYITPDNLDAPFNIDEQYLKELTNNLKKFIGKEAEINIYKVTEKFHITKNFYYFDFNINGQIKSGHDIYHSYGGVCINVVPLNI